MSSASAAWGGADDGRELVVGTLRGYRTWQLVGRRTPLAPGTLPLSSLTRADVTWPPVLRASCNATAGPRAASTHAGGVHRAPAPDCSCGIYAWYAPTEATASSGNVFGAIDASGLVLLGTHGFRAERARIAAIATRNRRLAAACAEVGIPVYRNRRDLVTAHPPDDVSTLLRDAPKERRRSRPAFAAVVCLFVWLRAAVLAVAADLLPSAAIVATVLVSEALLVALVLWYVRAASDTGGGVSATGAPAPDP